MLNNGKQNRRTSPVFRGSLVRRKLTQRRLFRKKSNKAYFEDRAEERVMNNINDGGPDNLAQFST